MSVMLVGFADYNTMFCCGCWRDRVDVFCQGGMTLSGIVSGPLAQ
jgi:hypothetical protein